MDANDSVWSEFEGSGQAPAMLDAQDETTYLEQELANSAPLNHESTDLSQQFQPQYPYGAFDVPFDLDWEMLLGPTGWMSSAVQNADTLVPDCTIDQAVHATPSPFSIGLKMHQIDAVEGKCIEIRHLLESVQTGIPLEPILTHINRDRLVRLVQSYASHYHPVQPIIHLPTFAVTSTPASLLLAIMLVGGCYTSKEVPLEIIVQCAIHLLHVMEASSVS